MKRVKVILFCVIAALLLSDTVTAAQYAFRVTFTDKNNTPYTFTNPSAYLCARSLARRSAQSIPLDSADFPVNPAYVDSVVHLTGGTLHLTSRWLNTCVLLLTDSTQILHLTGVSFISNVKFVGYYNVHLHKNILNSYNTIQPEALTDRLTTPGASFYGTTWTQTQLVNGNYLHDNGFMGSGKLIAVLDAGFFGADTHPGFDSLMTSGRLTDVFNFVNNNTSVYTSDAHGAQVLSTIAGFVPGAYVGTAPKAMFALYVTEYGGSEHPLEMDNMLAASERADSLGADIITESLGYDLFDNIADGQSFSDLDGKTTIAAKAANIATKKGMLFVASAGNNGSGIPGWGNHVLTPGDADSALTIGAVDYAGNIIGLSSYGPNAAGRIKPDVCAMGQSAAIFDNATGYTTLTGTSLSTPQIAGWAACLWQARPNSTPFMLRQAITKCASSYSMPGSQLGYGYPNFQCTANMLDVNASTQPFTQAQWIIAAPNPFVNNINLSISPDQSQDVTLKIYDISGKLVISTTIYLYKGYNTPFTFVVPGLPSGIYILKAISATQQQIIKLQKL